MIFGVMVGHLGPIAVLLVFFVAVVLAARASIRWIIREARRPQRVSLYSSREERDRLR